MKRFFFINAFIVSFFLGYAQEKQLHPTHVSPQIKSQLSNLYPKVRSVTYFEEWLEGKQFIEADVVINRKCRVTLVFQNNQFIESEIEVPWTDLDVHLQNKILKSIDSVSVKYSIIEIEKITFGKDSLAPVEFEIIIDSKQPQSELFEFRFSQEGILLRKSIRYKQVIQSAF